MKRPFAAPLVLVCAALATAGCRAREPGKARAPRPAATAASSQPAVLATLPDEEPPPPKGTPSALGLHAAPAAAQREFVFGARGGGVAWVVETEEGFQVVHNGRAGERYAAVGEVALSADGRRSAHGALVGGSWRMVVDGKPGEPFSAVRRPLFSPDGAHLAHEAMAGELWHLVVDGRPNAGTATRYLGHEFSGDSSRIAYIDDADERGEGRLVVSDLTFATHTVVAEGVSSAVSNDDRSRVAAVSRVDGRQRVIAFRFDDPDLAKWWPLYDAVHGVTFGVDGLSVAYVAERSGEHLVVLDEKEAPLPPGEALVGPPVIRPDRRAVAALVASGGSVVLRHFFEGAQGEARYEEAEGLVYDDDGRSHAFAARRGPSWFVVVNGTEGPPFDRVVSPVFSPDGKAVVYRARKGGMRFVVVADTKGNTRGHHRSYEQVFPVLFTADGKSAAYGVKDGKQLAWKVEAL